jgi:hypothetical protein
MFSGQKAHKDETVSKAQEYIENNIILMNFLIKFKMFISGLKCLLITHSIFYH